MSTNSKCDYKRRVYNHKMTNKTKDSCGEEEKIRKISRNTKNKNFILQ